MTETEKRASAWQIVAISSRRRKPGCGHTPVSVRTAQAERPTHVPRLAYLATFMIVLWLLQ